MYDDNELVTVIVELDAPAVMAQYQVSSYAAISEDSSAGQAVSEFLSSEESQQASQQILDGQQSIIDQISALSSNAGVAVASAEDGNGAGVVARWSNLLNGMAVRVPYGILGQIQQLDGVKRAYVEHVYDRPDEQAEVGDAPWYSYSYDKVDVKNVWQEGYTGKGLLVAVLDTGLDLKWSYSYDEEGNQTMQVTRTHEAFRNDSFVSGNPADGTDDWELRYTSESLASFLEDNQLNSTTGADGGQIVYDYNGLYKN